MTLANIRVAIKERIDQFISQFYNPAFKWLFLAGLTLVIGVAISIPEIVERREMTQRVESSLLKSPAHTFVGRKYLDCYSAPSNADECLLQTIALARIKGAEFEAQASAAAIEMGLLKDPTQ